MRLSHKSMLSCLLVASVALLAVGASIVQAIGRGIAFALEWLAEPQRFDLTPAFALRTDPPTGSEQLEPSLLNSLRHEAGMRPCPG